ncbi:uncharacterized protein METZ01_LOCUS387268, partial [marine metagenome]
LLLICYICRKWGNPATNKKDPAEAGSGSHVSCPCMSSQDWKRGELLWCFTRITY